ncbi:MAG: hypothetical protein SFZ24_04775 [Planctomycetota bacterium]|nr:hypothetical protein [Planctomycetota bacterium]
MQGPTSQPDSAGGSGAGSGGGAASRGGESAGLRLGPMVWVPELRVRSERDPWAHRKGEPRPLALLWALYLMSGSLLTLFTVRSLTVPTTEQFVLGCRGLMLVIVLGLCVLWPALRLSQAYPEKPTRSVLGDLGVLLAPVQAVVWPMPLLTYWSLEVTAGLSLMLTSWSLVAAVVVRWSYGRADGWGRRWATTAGLVALVAAAPAALAALGGWGGRAVELLSPLTAVWGLTDAPRALSPVMQPLEWGLAAAPGLFAVAVWVWLDRRRV